jgi:hypothetical protein
VEVQFLIRVSGLGSPGKGRPDKPGSRVLEKDESRFGEVEGRWRAFERYSGREQSPGKFCQVAPPAGTTRRWGNGSEAAVKEFEV